MLFDKLEDFRHAQFAWMVRLICMPIAVVDLEAAKGSGCLEGDGTDRTRMLPREMDNLLDLITVETIIKRDGQG